MSAPKHTPAPWRMDLATVTDADGDAIATVVSRLERNANRRLIAAAPDLLAVLVYAEKMMRATIGDRGVDHPMYVAALEARAVIAKAVQS